MNRHPLLIGGIIGLLFAIAFPVVNYATSTHGYYFGAMDLFGYYIDLDQNPVFAFTLVFSTAALVFIFLGLFLGYLFSDSSSLRLKTIIAAFYSVASIIFVIIGPEESDFIAMPTFIATLLASFYLLKHSRGLRFDKAKSVKESLLIFVVCVVGIYVSASLGGFFAILAYPIGAVIFLTGVINLVLNLITPRISLY